MDTVCKQLFDAYLIINPNTYPKRANLGPWCEYNTNTNITDIAAKIEENDELDLYFNSCDINARLYLDALECCPMTPRMQVDDNGLIYCTPGEEVIRIYRSDSNYDALRVDTLQISVICNTKSYFSYLEVLPKQLSLSEWTMMRDDLENEIKGLAQDIVRRNIGIGAEMQGALPPDDLYAFLVINKNANAIMSALLDIKERPKYKLQKHYELVDESKNSEIDNETVKCYLKKGIANHKLFVPKRDIVYDIQENRLLKKIVKSYDNKMSKFIITIEATLEYRRQRISKYQKQSLYDVKYIEGLENYLQTAEKLKKSTNIIKNAEWFREVSSPVDAFIPHSFAVDSRYGTIYRLYTEMNKQDFAMQLDPRYSYSWKKSSVLYEMWCYICVYRYFLQHYSPKDAGVIDFLGKDYLFPFLESGTQITFENDNALIEIVYDTPLPQKSKHVQLHNNPLYITGITGRHNRPDICINLYSQKSGWYIGSFIIECKYRKLQAFWNGKTWSSREQIIAYHNDSKSPLFFDGYLDGVTSSRPVHKVLVFTPDVFENKEFPDDKVELLTFRPTEDQNALDKVCNSLLRSIDSQVEVADQFYGRIKDRKGKE